MATLHQHALPSGYEFAGFHIESVLGAGGFGITYKARAIDGKARASGGGDPVAIKEYLPSGIATREPDGVSVLPVSTDDTADYSFGLDRFRAESDVLTRFSHPNVVRTRDFFEANGTAYLVMNFVDGESLYALLKPDHRLDADELDEIAGPLLDALEAVHAGGFLHRDIKPGNIVVQRDGAPVLIDFGAAREALGEKSQSLTSILTPGYAPPEQYHRRGNQGPWTDIYALGATFYRCIAGERPPPSVERVMRDEYVPAARRNKLGYSPSVLRGIDAALRIDEADRPQDIADWRRLLSGEIDEVSQLTRPIAKSTAPKLPPARPHRRPGARPVLGDGGPVRRPVRSWRRWGTTLASLAALFTVGTVGYYGFEQYRAGAGGEGEPVIASDAPPAGGDAEAKRAQEARRQAEEARRRSESEARRGAAEERRRAEEERRRAEEARRKPPARKRRAAPPRPKEEPKPAPGAARPAPTCQIAIAGLRPRLAASDCTALTEVLSAKAIEAARVGQTLRWRNAATGTSGSVTFVAKSTDAAGRPCWQLRQTLAGAGASLSGTGRACKVDAVWRIVR